MTVEWHPVRVRVPATSANLGPGFDALGLGLGWHDDFDAWVPDAGLDVSVAGQEAQAIQRGEQNLVVRAMRATFDHLGVHPPGLGLRCVNAIPHGQGMGSSAAAIVAGVCLARGLAGADVTGEDERHHRSPLTSSDLAMTDGEVFELAAALEGHPDNVAACLYGGVTIAWEVGGAPKCLRLTPASTLAPVVLVPRQKLSTEQARSLLPDSVPHREAAAAAGRTALLVAALTSQPDLLFDATEDWLHQSYRAAAIPHTVELLAKLRAAGFPAVISGAGPAVLVLAEEDSADSIGREVGTNWSVYRLGVDHAGARIRRTGPRHAQETNPCGE